VRPHRSLPQPAAELPGTLSCPLNFSVQLSGSSPGTPSGSAGAGAAAVCFAAPMPSPPMPPPPVPPAPLPAARATPVTPPPPPPPSPPAAVAAAARDSLLGVALAPVVAARAASRRWRPLRAVRDHSPDRRSRPPTSVPSRAKSYRPARPRSGRRRPASLRRRPQCRLQRPQTRAARPQ